MPNLTGVIYLSNEDYEILVSTGTVTIDGTTLKYDENTVYITPEATATPSQDGLMSAADKTKLDGIAAGATANVGTVTSVQVQAGTGLSSSTSTAQSVSLNTTISIASGYKLPTTTEWGNKQDVLPTTTTAGQVLKSTNTAGTVQWGTDSDTTYTVATGDSNGQIKVTPSSGNAYNVNVKGLGSAAYASTGTGSGNVPVLDTNGKLNTSVLPALAVTDTYVVASEAAMLALTAQKGDVAVRTDLNKSFILKNDGASTLSNWQELLTPTDAVTSVNGATGAVTFNYAGSSSVGGAANSVKASLTFNDGGSGVASGTTYDGSTARTISYNTIGAAAASHTHSYIPLSGTTALTGNIVPSTSNTITLGSSDYAFSNIYTTNISSPGGSDEPIMISYGGNGGGLIIADRINDLYLYICENTSESAVALSASYDANTLLLNHARYTGSESDGDYYVGIGDGDNWAMMYYNDDTSEFNIENPMGPIYLQCDGGIYGNGARLVGGYKGTSATKGSNTTEFGTLRFGYVSSTGTLNIWTS